LECAGFDGALDHLTQWVAPAGDPKGRRRSALPPHSKSKITSATLALSPASLSPAKLFGFGEIGLTLRLS